MNPKKKKETRRHKAASCWELEAKKDKRQKNWKKKEGKEEGALDKEVLLGCTKVSVIKYKKRKVLFEIYLWELVTET